MSNSYPRGTVEYVTATVTADVDLTMAIELSLTRSGVHTWLPAGWVGDVGPVRQVRTNAPVTLTALAWPGSSYTVYLRLTDSPEVPIINAGSLTIY